MSHVAWGGIALIVMSLGSLVIGILLWLRRRRLTAHTTGMVTALEERGGSGEFPVVTFTPAGISGGPSGPVQFHSSLSLGGHKVGDQLEIHYEPEDPQHASIAPAVLGWGAVLSTGAGGVIGLASGVVILVLLVPALEERDAAVERYFAAARSGDAQKLAAATASKARIDPKTVLAEAGVSRSIRIGSNTMNLEDSCVEVILEPQHVRYLAKLVKEKGRWRMLRASPKDAECEDEID